MATFYSDWGTAKSVKDSDSRRCQVHLKVDWSSDETKVYYTVNGYAHSGDNSGYYYCSDYGITVTLYYSLNGNSWISLGSASGTLNYNNNVANITKSVTINRTHSSQTIKFKAEGTGSYINTVNATSGTDTMRALTAYSVTYNGNATNVTNMPANDTKWYNETYTVTSATPKRASTTANGYTVIFNNNYGTTPATSSITVTNTINYSLKPNRWNTNSAGTSAAYTSGATITANNDIILYAQWTSSTVPGSIQSLPTPQSRGSDYTFLNWNTVRTPSTTTPGITYTAGSTFTPTTATTTLYAQWKQNYIPANLTNVSVIRVENNTSTAQIDTGTWGYVTVNWTKGGVNSASLNRNPNKIKWTIQNGSTTVSGTIPPPTIPSNTSSYNFHINGPSPTTSPNNGKLDPDKTWNLSVSIEDTYENTTYTSQKTTLLSSTYYTMDFLKGGKGIAFGKPATTTGFCIAMPTYHEDEDIILTASNIDRDGTSPSSMQYSKRIGVRDKDNENVAYIQASQATDGTVGASLICYGENGSGSTVANIIRATVASDGTRGYDISAPAAFRNAINAVGCSNQSAMNSLLQPFNGAKQLWGIASNVTNTNNTTYNEKRASLICENDGLFMYNNTDTATLWHISGLSGTIDFGVTTPAFTATTANWTVSETYIRRSGKAVSVSLAGQVNKEVSAWTNNTYQIGTISVAPAATKLFICISQVGGGVLQPFLGKIDSSGKVYLRTGGQAIPKDCYVWIDTTFITA